MQKILIIDDSKFARLKLGSFIKKAGFELIEAENGKIGLEKAGSEKPDCIICDILMPVMDGFDFLKRIKSSNIDIPVLTMTADIQESTKEKILRLGSREVLQKPPKEADLINAIQRVLKSKEA